MDVVKNKGKRPPTGWAEFGQRLREIRESRDLSREEVAHSTSLDAISLYRVEKGEQWISPKALRELSAVYDLPVSSFFEPKKAKNGPEKPSLVVHDTRSGIIGEIVLALARLDETKLRGVLAAIELALSPVKGEDFKKEFR